MLQFRFVCFSLCITLRCVVVNVFCVVFFGCSPCTISPHWHIKFRAFFTHSSVSTAGCHVAVNLLLMNHVICIPVISAVPLSTAPTVNAAWLEAGWMTWWRHNSNIRLLLQQQWTIFYGFKSFPNSGWGHMWTNCLAGVIWHPSNFCNMCEN